MGQGERTGLAAAHGSWGPDPAWPLPRSGLRSSLQGREEGETVVLWFKATLPAWHFHCFPLFFHCISVAARGMSFLDCFQVNCSFSSLSSTLLWVSFRSIFPLPSLSLSCQKQECFPESGQRLTVSWWVESVSPGCVGRGEPRRVRTQLLQECPGSQAWHKSWAKLCFSCALSSTSKVSVSLTRIKPM